ncbi:MAG: lycopene cyclase, partial [Deltaproteobacteria bacterium]|nr:lycopene cyclase [Deltaproteobacteria bacterium]
MLAERGGGELFERLRALDAAQLERSPIADRRDSHEPGRGPAARDLTSVERTDFDVVIAGGGIAGLLLAARIGRSGLRTALFEQRQIGISQREWNISFPELQALARAGLFNPQQLDALVAARYAHGICRWYRAGTYPVRGALDCAIDAAGLLEALRERCLAAGVELHERQAVVGERYGDSAVAIEVADAPRSRSARRATARGSTREVTARVLVDARGVASPHRRGDLVCPTVGGVLTGLEQGDASDQVDPAVGEILVTIDDVDDGRQHVWEMFPGRPGEAAVYLFYYARRTARRSVSLLDLYGRFFAQLGRYKRGAAELKRPAFGIIPGWSRLRREPGAPHPRCVL